MALNGHLVLAESHGGFLQSHQVNRAQIKERSIASRRAGAALDDRLAARFPVGFSTIGVSQ